MTTVYDHPFLTIVFIFAAGASVSGILRVIKGRPSALIEFLTFLFGG